MDNFHDHVEQIEDMTRSFIEQSFQKLRPRRARRARARRELPNIQSRESINQQINDRYKDILQQYTKELEAIHGIFDTHRENPPIYKNFPPVAARSLLICTSAKKPVLRFKAHEGLLSTEYGEQVKQRYLTFARAVDAYITPLYREGGATQQLSLIIRESKYLDRMGFAIPDAALNVTLQEDKYHSYRQNLQLKLRKYDALLASLSPVESELLVRQLAVLQRVLRTGFTPLNWNSQRIPFFIEACDKALNEFAGAVSQIQKSSTMIDDRRAIEGTVLAQAIDLRSDGRTGAPVLTDVTEFYEAMETKRALQNLVVHDQEPFAFSFFQDVSSNQHIVALQRSLTANIQNLTMSSGKISNYLESWTIYDRKYKLWDAKARANLEKLHDNPPSFVFFDAKLSFYAALSEQAVAQDARSSIEFIHIDASAVAEGIASQALQWRDQYGDILRVASKKAMDVLTEKIEAYEKDMAIEPEDLEALKFVLNTITTITDESMDMELKYFDAMRRYRTLQRTTSPSPRRSRPSPRASPRGLYGVPDDHVRVALGRARHQRQGRRRDRGEADAQAAGDLENSKFKAVETVIANFKESLPVIVNLKNEAMKDRHWNKLTEVTGVPIDNRGFILGGAEEIKLNLEDNMLNLQTMSGSRFVMRAEDGPRDWILDEHAGMVTLAGSQIWWTWEVEDAFRLGHGRQVRTSLNKINRKKVNTLLIIDVHSRDIVDSFIRESILHAKEFAWESQLRFYWDRDIDDRAIHSAPATVRAAASIQNALIYDKPSCDIGMGEIFVKRVAGFATCGFFITMNPGYAGRTELPDNLKALFRPSRSPWSSRRAGKCSDEAVHKEQIDKVIQMYETMIVRHTTMIVGPTGGGKTLVLDTLKSARLAAENVLVRYWVINPKAQPLHELYGIMDPVTRDWTDGVLSRLFRELNEPLPKGKENEMRWIIYDGDVDAVWVENMNSVMDDNRLLTLPNGERIRLQPHCAMICETFDLHTSPSASTTQFGLVDGELGAKLRSVIPITSIDMIKQLTTALDAFLGPLYEHMPPETLPERDDIENFSHLLQEMAPRKPILFVGASGTAKTTIINDYLGSLDDEVSTRLTLGFSSRTSSKDVQTNIEANVDKRTGNFYGPPVGKKLTIFIDDMNMPKSLPPTPAKFHYIFNLRDLSRHEGICLATPDTFDTSWSIVRLFRNEVQRIFCDRLVSEADLTLVEGKVSELIGEAFPSARTAENPLVFGDYKHAIQEKTKIANEQKAEATIKQEQASEQAVVIATEKQKADDALSGPSRPSSRPSPPSRTSTKRFTHDFRTVMIYETFVKRIADLKVPVTETFQLESFLSSDAIIQGWTAKGLPADEHSIQNGILTTPPEVMSKTMIINYSVTGDGLANQLLNVVVAHERPDLESQYAELVSQMSESG
ncbi:dynein light chain binding protein [Aureococcus anophagefferens]|nr:dynein light chain binding protein [Aureococcus anophagefferens]